MTSNVSLQRPRIVAPIAERRVLGQEILILAAVQVRLADKRSHQPVGVVAEKEFRVHLHCVAHRAARQNHLIEVKMLRVQDALRIADIGKSRQTRRNEARFQ